MVSLEPLPIVFVPIAGGSFSNINKIYSIMVMTYKKNILKYGQMAHAYENYNP
jgi:hypothetical protein